MHGDAGSCLGFGEATTRIIAADGTSKSVTVARYFNPDGTEKQGTRLAPNGKRSNLNKRQWIQVRTATFKDLYGDWENGGLRLEDLDRKAGEDQGREGYAEGDRQFAGIVDKNGEPVVFYHGTADDIEAFDLNHPNRKDTGWLGRGVYGSSDVSLANSYSNIKRGNAYPNVMPLFMAVKNPYIADLSLKQKLRNAPQDIIDRFTAVLQSKGFDGVDTGCAR